MARAFSEALRSLQIASLHPHCPPFSMKTVCRLLLPVLALVCFSAAAKKGPELTVRFHAEANQQDTERFASPAQLRFPPRSVFIEKVPTLSERHIKAIFPFKAPDGTWGCAFQLDGSGRLALEVLSTDRKGTSLVVFVSTKNQTHQVIDMLVDQRVTDGVVTVQHGLTDLEIAMLRKQYRVLGEPAAKKRG